MSYIAKVYVDLIRKGEKDLADVPEKIKREVQQLLDQDGKEND